MLITLDFFLKRHTHAHEHTHKHHPHTNTHLHAHTRTHTHVQTSTLKSYHSFSTLKVFDNTLAHKIVSVWVSVFCETTKVSVWLVSHTLKSLVTHCECVLWDDKNDTHTHMFCDNVSQKSLITILWDDTLAHTNAHTHKKRTNPRIHTHTHAYKRTRSQHTHTHMHTHILPDVYHPRYFLQRSCLPPQTQAISVPHIFCLSPSIFLYIKW